ncbi:MAG TPA: hypothetical protein DDY78_04885 [Planctomycetales bacterium]|nr:hypothetical protein [Planctomycetales bacterium]
MVGSDSPFWAATFPYHRDRELATIPVYHLHLDARLLPQSGRQTGGMLTDRASDRAFADLHLLHSRGSFRVSQANIVALLQVL